MKSHDQEPEEREGELPMNHEGRLIEFLVVGSFYSILGTILVILLPNMAFLTVIIVIVAFVNYIERSLDESLAKEGFYHV